MKLYLHNNRNIKLYNDIKDIKLNVKSTCKQNCWVNLGYN